MPQLIDIGNPPCSWRRPSIPGTKAGCLMSRAIETFGWSTVRDTIRIGLAMVCCTYVCISSTGVLYVSYKCCTYRRRIRISSILAVSKKISYGWYTVAPNRLYYLAH